MCVMIYDAYASIYDTIGQGRFAATMAAWALGYLADRGARPWRALDLACGTGAAALVFAAAGCAVVGVDQSAAMLDIARGKARDTGARAVFVEDDMRAFLSRDQGLHTKAQSMSASDDQQRSSLVLGPSSFDLVTCFYDSLNYLVEDGDLDRVLAQAATALRSGGWMIFDINTEAEYATWDERDMVTYDGGDVLVYNKLSYDPAERRATGRIAWFVRAIERWWRGEETHTQRAWSDDEVRAGLAGAGLLLIERLTPEDVPIAAAAPRVVYVAKKADL